MSSLYIELKVGDGKPTPEQKEYLHALEAEWLQQIGFANCGSSLLRTATVALAYSAAEAIRLIERYIRGEERA